MLQDLESLHTIAFVTDRRPSPAVLLARQFNPNSRILVIAPRTQRDFVTGTLNVTWADFDAHATRTVAFSKLFKQGAPGALRYHRFCHMRWLVLAASLRDLLHTAEGRRSAVAVLDDDVLLYESVADRLREAGRFHPTAHAEVVVSGAFVIGSVSVFTRFAAFLWALYALPEDDLGKVAWRFGASMAVGDLGAKDRARIHKAFRRGERFARFSDMDAVEAYRFLARTPFVRSTLPARLRSLWAAGHRRESCVHAPKVEKLGALEHVAVDGFFAWTLPPPPRLGDGREGTEGTSVTAKRAILPMVRGLRAADGTHSARSRPLCFLHLQGPRAKALLMDQMLLRSGVVAGPSGYM